MGNDAIRNSLGPAPGLGPQTTKLADNIQSMKAAVAMLQQTVATVQGASPEARQMMAPLLASTVQPLLNMAQTASQDLELVAGRMRGFINDISANTSQVKGHSGVLLSLLVTQLVNQLQADATATKAAATNASQMLTNFRANANSASATLNTFSENLSQQDTELETKVHDLESKMHSMTSGNCCDQIGHAFQMAFGHLKSELESASREIQQTEYVIAVNRNAIAGLTQMVNRMGDISSVASALEVSWRSMADGIVALQGDLSAMLSDTTAADIQADLEYVQSDWQAIQTTLNKVA